ncbi:MAG: TetR/AcrR family transcriptional regulator [Limnothrix sp. RL_2_0]|nr:TetR/AcrR family transcriptional regulator [Limnothrix sp. RL_2_0]
MTNEAPQIPERNLSSSKGEAILRGGMQEFLKNGYAATSMDRVAKAAQVSKATVYSHFQDKEGLFIAIIKYLVEEKFQTIFEPIGTDNFATEPEIILKELANRMLDTASEELVFQNFMRVIIGESGRFPQLARAFVTNVEATGFRVLRDYFTHCPRFNFADPEAIARIFVGSIVHFLIVQEMLHGKDIVPMERDRLIDSLIALIVPDKKM